MSRSERLHAAEVEVTTPFPETVDFSGYNAPSLVECDDFDLVVEGKLPAEINGSWYQCAPGHEGYLLFLVDRHDEFLAEAFIVEAEHLGRGPIARVKIPLRLRVGVHGNWVLSTALEPTGAR